MNGQTRSHAARRRSHMRIVAVTLLAPAGAAFAQYEWTHFAGSPLRTGTTLMSAPSLSTPAWVCSADAQGNPITFSGQSGSTVSLDLVLALGYMVPPGQSRQDKVFAINRRTGLIAWATPVPAPYVDSWSSPAIDATHRTVVVGSGAFVTAFDLGSGAQAWQAPLSHPVVDASPLVTSGWGADGLGVANRCFVTEYDGFGDDGRLTCIDVDAWRAGYNAHQPGDVLWSVVIGASSGNTPAVWNGRVFVTSAGDGGSGPGRVIAFDARAEDAPGPLWVTENAGEAFFGGVCVRPRTGGADLFCASYAFYGGTTSANLLKLDAATGAVRWSTPCNRTSATPLVLPDGRIVVSGGIRGYGTVPTIQLFRDDGDHATQLWDSSAATWSDVNQNGVMDLGEYLLLGGWSHQPLLALAAPAGVTVGAITSGSRLIVGAVPTNPASAGACTDLYAIDVNKLPSAPGPALPGFLAQHFVGAGSTPAAAGGNLYTLGPAGLHAFGPAPFRFDVNGDGRIDIDDLYAWEEGQGQRDVNLDGQVTSADREALLNELRAGEFEDMRAGRNP